MNPQRDNVRAGVFVLVGLTLAVVAIILLSDFQSLFARTQQVKVYYSLADNLQGLKPGARVTIGGQPSGEVVAIEHYVPAAGDARLEGQLITLSVPASLKLYWNARIELERPPLGSNTTINIASVGRAEGQLYNPLQPIPEATYRMAFPEMRTAIDPASPMRPLPPGAIPGQIAGSALTQDLTRDMGITDVQRYQIQEIIQNTRQITADLGKLSAALGSRGGTVAETIDNIHAVTVAFKQDMPEMSASAKRAINKVETLVDDARVAVKDLQAAAKDVKTFTGDFQQRSGKWMTDIDTITDSAAKTLADLRKLVADKDPAIREAIDNIQAITKTGREKTMRQIEVALDKATDAIENLRTASHEVKGMVISQRPVLERALANAQLTTSQLKLAAIEVRRSPWRLLYAPDDKELETDNLYDAARSFALAASTLDAAARSLQTVSEKDPANKEKLKRMLDDLESLFGKFKEAENEFWKALKDKPPK